MDNEPYFIPELEGRWRYQSFLVEPTDEQVTAAPTAKIDCTKWAMGTLQLADGPEFTAVGTLVFQEGVALDVSVTFEPEQQGGPAKFAATGTAPQGPIAGASYELTGWVAPPSSGSASLVEGTIRATRGLDARPGFEPGGRRVGTVGFFRLKRLPEPRQA